MGRSRGLKTLLGSVGGGANALDAPLIKPGLGLVPLVKPGILSPVSNILSGL